MKPLILLATERSGTNLLRRIVDSHPQIAAPPPSGLIACMERQRYRYLYTNYQYNPKGWVCAALALIKSHPSDWGITIKADDVLSRIDEFSHWALYKTLNEIYAESHKASYWFSKEPGTLQCAYEILMHMPDAKFIYLIRDGRDVVSSMLEGGLHADHVFQAAHLWNSDQVRALNYLCDPCIRNKTFVVKYEDILSDDKKIIQDLFKFIGLEPTDSVFSSEFGSDAGNRSNDSMFWKNLDKPILKDNIGKYKDALPRREVQIFESIAGTAMEALGYKLEYSNKLKFGLLEKIKIIFETKLSKYKKKINPVIRREVEIRSEFREMTKKINQGYDFTC